MTAKHEPAKTITVTRDDVLTALSKHPDSLNTVADIARWVVVRVHGVEHVYDGKTALWYVHQAELRRLLADMVDDGALIKRTGEEWWDHGAPTHLGRSNGHYYVMPEPARVWEQEGEKRRDAALQERAEEFARGVLAERHPEEFASLVHAYREENGAAVAEGAGQ
jgi:hypothetical protein